MGSIDNRRHPRANFLVPAPAPIDAYVCLDENENTWILIQDDDGWTYYSNKVYIDGDENLEALCKRHEIELLNDPQLLDNIIAACKLSADNPNIIEQRNLQDYFQERRQNAQGIRQFRNIF